MLTIEEVRLIRELYNKGLSHKEISKELGRPYSNRKKAGIAGVDCFYSAYLLEIIKNKIYKEKGYKPRIRNTVKHKGSGGMRRSADECEFHCPVCGMAYSLHRDNPFASADEAGKCCERISLCPERDIEREYRTDGDIIKRPRPVKSAARGVDPCKCYLRLAR